MKRYEITRAAHVENLAVFRAFIDDACAEVHIDTRTCMALKVAVDEACTNIIEHGYKGMNPGSIILSLRFEKARVVVIITDFGHTFEPAEPPTPDVAAIMEDPSAGSFGLHLIYQTMDEIQYASDATSNRLIFIKNL